jgi:hypothetical protein
VTQWQEAHDDKERQIEQLNKDIVELTSEPAIRQRELAAQQNWRADGGQIELVDDARDDQHARVLTTLQNDVVDLEDKFRTTRGERDKARDQRDGLSLELTDLRATHKKQHIKAERDFAAASVAKERKITKLEALVHQQATDGDRLRLELREMTMLMEDKEGIEVLERQLGDQVCLQVALGHPLFFVNFVSLLCGLTSTHPSVMRRQVSENSSIDEIRAVLASVQMAREFERLNHLKELTKMHELHTNIAVELAESRSIDEHQHAMESRAEEIQELLFKAKELHEIRTTRRRASRVPMWTDTADTPLKSLPIGVSPKQSPNVVRKTTPAKKKRVNKAPKSAIDVAKSKARTNLILAGLKPTPKSPRNVGGYSRSPPSPDSISLGRVLRKSPTFNRSWENSGEHTALDYSGYAMDEDYGRGRDLQAWELTPGPS